MKHYNFIKKAIDLGYSADTQGRIRGLRGNIMKSRKQNSGYQLLHICVLGTRKAITVHQFVWVFFGGKDCNELNHIDGNKNNNAPTNIEETTRSGNSKHAYKLKLRTPLHGTRSGRTILSDKDVLKMRELHSKGMLIKNVASKFGVAASTASYILNRRTWFHI